MLANLTLALQLIGKIASYDDFDEGRAFNDIIFLVEASRRLNFFVYKSYAELGNHMDYVFDCALDVQGIC